MHGASGKGNGALDGPAGWLASLNPADTWNAEGGDDWWGYGDQGSYNEYPPPYSGVGGVYSMSMGLSALSYATGDSNANSTTTTRDNDNTTTSVESTTAKESASDTMTADQSRLNDKRRNPTTTTTTINNNNGSLVYNNTILNRPPISLHNKYEVLTSPDASCLPTTTSTVKRSTQSIPALPNISELASSNVYVPPWARCTCGETCCSAEQAGKTSAQSEPGIIDNALPLHLRARLCELIHHHLLLLMRWLMSILVDPVLTQSNCVRRFPSAACAIVVLYIIPLLSVAE